jgi:hypothetical protein
MASGRVGLAASSTLLNANAKIVAMSSVFRRTRPTSSRDRGSAVNTMTAA